MLKAHYHRAIIGYHGCDQSIVDEVLLKNGELEASHNNYDWLGEGIYFWEYGPQRAYDWAVWKSKHPSKHDKHRIMRPAVLGAYIQLGHCFDLLDTQNTRLLNELFPHYKKTCEARGVDLPENTNPKEQSSSEFVLRYRDCAVIDWCLSLLKRENKQNYDTVRCVFTEGEPAFEGSKIMLKSHIQIAVRNPDVILGYFKPQGLTFDSLEAD